MNVDAPRGQGQPGGLDKTGPAVGAASGQGQCGRLDKTGPAVGAASGQVHRRVGQKKDDRHGRQELDQDEGWGGVPTI
jgi:hypothetical protein